MAPTRSLTTFDAAALVVGIVVGVGIFRAPQLVAQNTGSAALFLLAWGVGGLISLIGALCYAELATAYPSTGGEYHFLRRAFGPNVSFLFGWSRSTVIQTGSLAVLTFVFADYMAPLLAIDRKAGSLLAAIAVLALTAINLSGLHPGRWTQNVLTVVHIIGLSGIVLVGLLYAAPSGQAVASQTVRADGSPAIGLAMVFVLLTYGGWNEAAYISAEVRDGRRGVSRALFLGIGVITVLYMLANIAYLKGLGIGGVADSSVIAADLMRRAVGEWGAVALSTIVAIGALGSANAVIITGARSTHAFGRDVALLGFLSDWRDRRSTPANALLVQAGIALLLIVFGAATRSGFEAMVSYTAPVFWFFFTLVALSVIVLRRRDPARSRPFRVPLYPLTPLLFCGSSLFMFYSSIRHAGYGALLGVAVMLAGIPVLLLTRPRSIEPTHAPDSNDLWEVR